MNASTESVLMRYADGELSGGDTERLRRFVELRVDAREIIERYEQIGDAVRTIAERRARAADGLSDRVMARLLAESVRVARSSAGARGTSGSRSFPARAFAAGLAAAAVAVFATSFDGLSRVHSQLETSGVVPPGPARTALAAPRGPAPTVDPGIVLSNEGGASVEELELGNRNATLFVVASGAETTPVVWLTDDAQPNETETL